MEMEDLLPEQRRSRWSLVALLLLGISIGFLTGRLSVPTTGASPAIDTAREIGVAIPEVQMPAFSDGEITLRETEQAYSRFVECVGDQGALAGFFSTLEKDGSLTISIQEVGDDSLQRLVYRCQIEHLEATRQVYVSSRRLAGD